MKIWLVIWTSLLLFGLLSYALLALVVTVGGMRDVLELFRSLNRQHGDARPPKDPTAGP